MGAMNQKYQNWIEGGTEFFLMYAQEVEGGLKLNNAQLYVVDPEGIDRCVATLFHHITPKGWRSAKALVLSLEVLRVDLEDQVIFIDKASALELLQYQGGKVFETEESKARRRNAAAWNYIAANYITHPNDD